MESTYLGFEGRCDRWALAGLAEGVSRHGSFLGFAAFGRSTSNFWTVLAAAALFRRFVACLLAFALRKSDGVELHSAKASRKRTRYVTALYLYMFQELPYLATTVFRRMTQQRPPRCSTG